MKRFRYILSIIVLILLAISSISCQKSSSAFSGSKTGNDTQFLVDFEVLNTTVNNDMILSNGDEIDTLIDIEKGKVNILVKSENDTIIYQGDDVKNGNFSLGITESGNYTFYITGDKAKGSVYFVKSLSKEKKIFSKPTEEAIITNMPTITNTPIVTQSIVEEEDTSQDYSPVLMPTPPFSYFLSDTAIEKENTSILLNMTYCEPNEITDTDEWFSNNDLSLGRDLDDVEGGSNEIYFYEISGTYDIDGNILNIYDARQEELLYAFDFSNYAYSPEYQEEDYEYIQQEIKWATIKDGILYVSHSHNTYAESSNNMNAYITAIDLSDMSILWRSDALVCNSNNFLIIDNVIISGYGFTYEPDYLYQIDCNTGKILEKTLLKSAPEHIIKKNTTLYVRTYNTDYQFNIE